MQFELFGYQVIIQRKSTKDNENLFKKCIPSDKQVESARRASQIKADRAKEKIRRAIDELKALGEEVTVYKVAKTANVSYNTAKKYLKSSDI